MRTVLILLVEIGLSAVGTIIGIYATAGLCDLNERRQRRQDRERKP